MNDFYDAESAQAAFFDEVYGCFIDASARRALLEVPVCIAQQRVSLQFCSATLAQRFLPALAHAVQDTPGEPDFRLCLWDSVSTGVTMPLPPCDRNRFTDRGDIWGFTAGRFRVAFHYGEFSVNLFDRARKLGIFWVQDPAKLPYWSDAAPLRTLFHWCMEMADLQLLHAAAVGTEQGALLLTGRGGIGKSTTALTALCEGMQFAGDDYVVVGLTPEPQVFPLYSTAKVNSDQTATFPQLASVLKNPGCTAEEKAVFTLFPRYRNAIAGSMRLRAIVLPELTGKPLSALQTPLAADEVQQAASFTTVAQLPYSGRRTYAFIDRLAASLPGYRLELGTERKQLIEVLRQFLKEPPVSSPRSCHSLVCRTDQTPLVSVIIPVFNRERLVNEVLRNVLAQDYPALELIVVNDGSTDGTAQAVKAFPYEIRYFEQPNSGPAQARNRGIINARGELIAFLDSDDLWPERMLWRLVNALSEDPQADVVRGYGQLARLNPDTGEYEYEGNPLETFPNYITGSVFRRRAFDKVGLFDRTLRFGEDNDWFNRAEEQGLTVKRLPCTSVIVRRHSGNMTFGKNLVELNVLRVFKKALDRKRRLSEDSNPEPGLSH